MSMVNISFIVSLSSSPHTLNFTPMLQVAKDVTPKFIPPCFLPSQCTPNLLKIYVSTNNSHYISHISFQKKLSYEDTCMHGSQACSFSILFGRVVYIRKSGLASIILGYHLTIFHPPSRSICPLPGSELWESCLKSASVKLKEEED